MDKFYRDRWKGRFISWKGGPDFSIGMGVSPLSGQPLDLGPHPGKYYHEGVLPVHYEFEPALPSQLTEENSLNRLSTMIQQMAQLEDMKVRYYEFNPYELREITVKFFPELLHRVDDVFFGEINYNYGVQKHPGRDAFFKKHTDLTWFDTPFSEAHEISPTTIKAHESLITGNVKASRNNLEKSFISWFHNRMKDATSQAEATRMLDSKVWNLITTDARFNEEDVEKTEQDLIDMIDSIINAQLQPHSSPTFSIQPLLVTLNTEGWKALRSIWTRFQLWKVNRPKPQDSSPTKHSSSIQHAPPPTQHHESLSMDQLAAQQEREAFDEQSRFQEAFAQRREKEFAAQEKILVKQREEQLKQEKILEKKALEQKEQQLKQEKILEKKAADLVAEQKKAATLAEKQRLEEKLRKEKLEAAAEKERRLLIAREEENLKEEKKRIEMLQKEELKRTEMLQKEELRLKAEAHSKEMGELAIKTEADWRAHKIRLYQETWSEMHREEREIREKAEQKIKEEAQRKKIAEERKIIEENEKREKQKLKEEKDRISEIKKNIYELKSKQLKVFEENLNTSFAAEISSGIDVQSEETMENFIKETKEKVQAHIKEMGEGYSMCRARANSLKLNQTAAIKIIDDLYERWKASKMIESREKEIRDEIVKTKKNGEDLLTYLGTSFAELIKNVEKLKLSAEDKEELLEKARSNFQVIADSFAPDSTIQKIITDISEINDLADLKRYLNDLSSKTNNSLHHHLKQLLHKDGGTNIKLLVDKLKEKTGSKANWLVSTDGTFLDTVELSKQNMKEQQKKKNKKKELAKQQAQQHPSAAYVPTLLTENEIKARLNEQSDAMLKTATKLPGEEKKEPKRDESQEKVRTTTTTSTKKTVGGKMKNMSKKNNKRTMNRFKIVRKINKNSKRKMNRFTKNRRKRSIKNKRSIYRNFIFSRNIF